MKKKDYKSALISIQKLATWQYRWYSQFSPYLLHCVREILAEEGALKMRSLLLATGWPPKVLELTMHYSALCAAFRTEGSDTRYTGVQNPLKQDQSPATTTKAETQVEM
jgi:Chs5-Arf1p-binding protein BUD7/BCH1